MAFVGGPALGAVTPRRLPAATRGGRTAAPAGPVMAAPPPPISRRSLLPLLAALPLVAGGVGGGATPPPAAAASLSLKETGVVKAVNSVTTAADKLTPLLESVRKMPAKLSADDVGYLHRARAAIVTPLLSAMAKAAEGVGGQEAATVVAKMRGHDLELVGEIRGGRGQGVARELEEMVESVDDLRKATAGWMAAHK
ncbi:hypothetical protein BU14_0328s0026 [Porphyra umbilicalis]|uniref:Uncharacterized protein n=1 Tax=Porphyra umbilicalis TaxID=2786 RepID=A0A1X6NYS9_PORUM|nr:hypothetical protein BU14_0328s0026 [Porphyra umbilicalis]|eukprot:OSX73774.1 hypothetical protein BU14_0328s0026 [Porphyra umbilicalis]